MDGNDTDVACEAVVIASGLPTTRMDREVHRTQLGKTVTAMGNTGKMGTASAWYGRWAAEGMGVLHLIRVAPFAGFPS